ncbi:MAG: hypothetical protein M3P50_09860 [Actinomycetota bacterium]|nr:hypothetical protein [Actinomycetota bacterium]
MGVCAERRWGEAAGRSARALLRVMLLSGAARPASSAGATSSRIDLPEPYLLLAAMPAGINGLVVAHAYGLDLQFAAAAIAWSTAVVVVVALVAAGL